MGNPETNWMKWERKYSFALIGILLSISILYLVHLFNFPEKVAIVAIVSTQLIILITTVTYLTGQARIDVAALYGRPSGAQVIPSPPNGGKVGL